MTAPSEPGAMCAGRVCIVTGAGRGIGREHALLLARHGATVIVNDVGVARDGSGFDASAADEVVAEIVAAGGVAAASAHDVSDMAAAGDLIGSTIERFGRLDVLVTNAGILRDKTIANMSEAEWDDVVRVHLKGTFAPLRHAVDHWRQRSKAGEDVDGRLITTTSASGLYGNVGQANYAAAKAGIAAMTIVASMELVRYGVTANAVAPGALTRMTEDLGIGSASEETKAAYAPHWIAPLVVWLASAASAGVTGRVFEISGRGVAVAEGWHRGPSGPASLDPAQLGDTIGGLLESAAPNADMNGRIRRPEKDVAQAR